MTGVVIGGTVVLMNASTGKETATAGPFYYDLENFGNSRGLFDRGPRPPLKLLIVPTRDNATGLMVRVEVWNLSDESQRVYPISPFTYHPEFRDAAGKSLIGSLLPPAVPRGLTVDKLARIDPGNCLSANHRFPTFYTRMAGANGIECRVGISIYFELDRKSSRRAHFELWSDWVKVPGP